MMHNNQKIPEGWNVKKLEECFSFSAGGDVDKDCFSETKDDLHPYPIYANALTNEGLYGYSSKYKVKEECITITGRGDIGNVFYRKGYFTPIVRLITAIPNAGIKAKFMSYACSQIHFFDESTGVPQLTVPQVQWYKILLPPLPEQEKIAEILGTWDEAIEKLSSLIEQKKLFKKGLMQKLLTGKVRLPGFTQPWKEVKLGNFCRTFSGGTPSVNNASFYDGNIPFIRSGEIHLTSTALFISESGLTNSAAKLVEKGDILFALYGATSGEVDISKINGAINQAILCIKPLSLNKYFLKDILEYKKQNILNKYLQGGQGNLSAEIIKSLKIYIPSDISEQQAIANVLSTADDEINLLNQKLEALKEQKKGLMQQLLTGQVRVKVN